MVSLDSQYQTALHGKTPWPSMYVGIAQITCSPFSITKGEDSFKKHQSDHTSCYWFRVERSVEIRCGGGDYRQWSLQKSLISTQKPMLWNGGGGGLVLVLEPGVGALVHMCFFVCCCCCFFCLLLLLFFSFQFFFSFSFFRFNAVF